MKAMIVSLGGTIEPVVASIMQLQPDFVCFLVSQQSVDNIGLVKSQLEEKEVAFDDWKVIADDPNDLVHCYEKALECVAAAEHRGAGPRDISIDYTGGTKAMTGALILATVSKGHRFIYVGGEERNKGGLGVVVTGKGKIFSAESPWRLFAVEEKRLIATFINSYQYSAALKTIEDIIPRLPQDEAVLWGHMAKITSGFDEWDRFEHRKAAAPLWKGTNGLEESLKLSPDEKLEKFFEQAKSCREVLADIQGRTNKFRDLDESLALDVLANAKRRAEQGRYDDAVARLYRALEMVGQIAYLEEFGHSNSDAKLDKLPESLREEYGKRYTSSLDRKVKLPLEATFRALEEAGHPKGKAFFEHQRQLEGLLFARNSSILAHGTEAVGGETFEKLFGLLREVFLPGELVSFPSLGG